MQIKVGKVKAGKVTVDGKDVDPRDDAAKVINERFGGKGKASKKGKG